MENGSMGQTASVRQGLNGQTRLAGVFALKDIEVVGFARSRVPQSYKGLLL
jgi:hypothetical protein